MKFPITLIIPLVLVVSTTITSLIMYQKNLESEDKDIRNYALQELKLDITRLQNILYNLLTENKIADARVNLSVSAMKPEFKTLILTDEENKIIAANRYIWIDSIASKIVDYDNKMAAVVKLKNKPETYFDKERSYILKGYYPVVLQLESDKNISQKKLGVLFAEVNIKNKLIKAENKARNQSVVFAVSMFITSLFVAVLLHLVISRRLRILSVASENISKGKYNVSVPVSGNDEITDLAKTYNKMLFQVNEAIAVSDKSKNELVKLNETLEEKIEERTNLLKQAQHIAKIGNWVWHVEENSFYCSEEIYEICGIKQEEITLTYENFLKNIHPEDISRVKSGIENTLENKEHYIGEHRVLLPDNSVRWVREDAISEIGSDDKCVKITGIMRDITKEKHDAIEKERIEREIQQMQKMESLGQLTGGIAHDFNNMLAIILGYNELAQALANRNKDQKLNGYLDQIKASSKRASELVMQMLAFSKVGGELNKKENISLFKILSETSTMLRPLLSSSVRLNIPLTDEEHIVYADASLLNQMIVNLCINAKDAMLDGQGHIDIEVDEITLNEMACSSCFKPISGDFTQITIKDDGAGISEDKLNRIFEPFYTTKGVGEGTGMGLAMVHGIMHKHQGHLIVESKKDIGSTFKLLFPVTEIKQEIELKKDSMQNDEHVDINTRILIVDDEAAITLYLQELLEDKGYSVTAINDSRAALEYFILNDKDIDLVITDFTMPGMTGMQLSEYMLTHRPGIPIIMCSGFSDDVNKEKATSKNIKAYIEKPINSAQLLSEIKNYI